MLKEVLFFPDKPGILFRQGFGKTLRGDAQNVFAVRRCESNTLCPVKNFERYLSLCRLMGLHLQSGFLFRTTRGNSVTEQPFVGSAVYNRLKFYLQKINAEGVLLLSLCWKFERKTFPDVGWASTRMVDFYK